MVLTEVVLIATVVGSVAAVVGAITGVLVVWKDTPVWRWLRNRLNRNRLYNHLSPCDRDILKALSDSDTRQVSGGYDGEDNPRIHTMLDCIPGAPVDCRLKVSGHYRRSLDHLASRGLLKENESWDVPSRYDPSQRYVKAYRLTSCGEKFICKYATGLHRGERFVRRWIKGLNRRKYDGRYCDKVGPNARERLPNYLRGTVWLKYYRPDAKPLGSDQMMRPSIYEYRWGSRSDGVECMVEIPLTNLDIADSDQVVIAVSTSNMPQHLKFKPGVAESSDAYWIQAVVLSVVESNRPVGTVLNLVRCREFVPDFWNF